MIDSMNYLYASFRNNIYIYINIHVCDHIKKLFKCIYLFKLF